MYLFQQVPSAGVCALGREFTIGLVRHDELHIIVNLEVMGATINPVVCREGHTDVKRRKIKVLPVVQGWTILLFHLDPS